MQNAPNTIFIKTKYVTYEKIYEKREILSVLKQNLELKLYVTFSISLILFMALFLRYKVAKKTFSILYFILYLKNV